MKTQKLLIALLILLLAGTVQAKKINIDIAKQVALNAYNKKMKENSAKIIEILPDIKDNDTLFYIVNFNDGFVIVSTEDATPPILGYGKRNSFKNTNIPPSLNYLLSWYEDEILALRKLDAKPTDKVKAQWNDLLSGIYLKTGTPVVGPLCPTTWGQGQPPMGTYNQYCPGNAFAGCIAVAMAQVLYYWNCRVEGTGDHCYTDDYYGQQCADFEDANYQWLNMSEHNSDQNNALLIYHCGVSVDMDYGYDDGSGASMNSAVSALKNYFGFKTQTGRVNQSDFSLNNWILLLKYNLDNGLPIIFGGQNKNNNPDYQHAWVIDGYDDEDYFHCNWGYDGDADNWYWITSLNPIIDNEQLNLNYRNCAIINAEPVRSVGVETPNLSPQTFTFNPSGYNITIPGAEGATSYEWITNHGTISGSGTTATLVSNCNSTVQVRAYNSQCEIYSSYGSTNITINYGPISGSNLVCYSGTTYSIVNPPANTTITWGGNNVAYPNGNTGTSITVRAARPSAAITGTVTASFTIDGTPYTISKDVWVGPEMASAFSPFDLDQQVYTWTLYAGTPYEFRASLSHPSEDPSDYFWTVWDQEEELMYMCPSGTGGYFAANPGYYTVNLIFNNGCGWGDERSEVFEFLEGEGMFLQITPNPAFSEVTIELKSADANKKVEINEEWELEVFAGSQLLMEKKTKLKGSKYILNISSWKESIYIIRANYKGKILQGKLVVKK